MGGIRHDKPAKAPAHYNTFAEFQYFRHYGDIYSPHVEQVEPLKVECRDFRDSVKAMVWFDCSGIEGLKAAPMLEAASQSLQNAGGRVEISELAGTLLNS
jgi:hypothetical protein